MYLVAIAWLYVALMMALAEAVHPAGGWLGAVFTFVLYGLAPVSLVMYLMATPLRRRARQRDEQAERATARTSQTEVTPDEIRPAPVATSLAAAGGSVGEPDHGGHAPGPAIAPVREEP